DGLLAASTGCNARGMPAPAAPATPSATADAGRGFRAAPARRPRAVRRRPGVPIRTPTGDREPNRPESLWNPKRSGRNTRIGGRREAEPVHLELQRPPRDPQVLRGAGLVPGAALEGLEQDLALEVGRRGLDSDLAAADSLAQLLDAARAGDRRR